MRDRWQTDGKATGVLGLLRKRIILIASVYKKLFIREVPPSTIIHSIFNNFATIEYSYI